MEKQKKQKNASWTSKKTGGKKNNCKRRTESGRQTCLHARSIDYRSYERSGQINALGSRLCGPCVSSPTRNDRYYRSDHGKGTTRLFRRVKRPICHSAALDRRTPENYRRNVGRDVTTTSRAFVDLRVHSRRDAEYDCMFGLFFFLTWKYRFDNARTRLSDCLCATLRTVFRPRLDTVFFRTLFPPHGQYSECLWKFELEISTLLIDDDDNRTITFEITILV